MARKTSETAFFGVFCIYPTSGQTQSGHVLCKGLSSRTSALVKRRFSVTIRLQHCSGGSIQKNIQKNHWRSTPILVQNHLTSLLKIPTIFLLKRQAATSTIQETQQSIGGDEADLKVRAASYDLWGWEVEISGKDGGCRSNFSSKTYDLTGKEMEISSQTYWWRDIEQHLSWYNDTIHNDTDTQGIFSKPRGCSGRWQGFYPWAMADPAHFRIFCSRHPRQGNVASWLV